MSQPNAPRQKPRAKLRDSFILQNKDTQVDKRTEETTRDTRVISQRAQSLKAIIQKHEKKTNGNSSFFTDISICNSCSLSCSNLSLFYPALRPSTMSLTLSLNFHITIFHDIVFLGLCDAKIQSTNAKKVKVSSSSQV